MSRQLNNRPIRAGLLGMKGQKTVRPPTTTSNQAWNLRNRDVSGPQGFLYGVARWTSCTKACALVGTASRGNGAVLF